MRNAALFLFLITALQSGLNVVAQPTGRAPTAAEAAAFMAEFETRLLDLWIARSAPSMIRLADIFFDFRCVYGDASLADRLRATVTRQMKTGHGFLESIRRYFGKNIIRIDGPDQFIQVFNIVNTIC